MAKYAADNIMFLKKEYPAIYAQIRGYELSKHSLTTSKNGLPNIIVRTGEIEEAIYSNYNPAMEAERWLQTVGDEFEDHEQVLLYGLGLGYHMEKLIERYPDKKYYIIEPDVEVFRAYLESRPMQAVLSHPSIAAISIGSHSTVYYDIAEIIAANVKGGFSILATPFYNRVYSEELRQLKDHMKRYLLNYRSNLGTHYTFETDWPKNIITNLPKILETPDLSHLKNAFEKVPAIIVGSGPSLQRDIETIRRLQDKCLVIAAGTSTQALVKNDIWPDLAVSMDGGKANYVAFNEIDLTKVPLLFASTIHHGILRKEIKYGMYVSLNLDTISSYIVPDLKETPVFYSTASVTGMAIQAAAYLGCGPVLLTGQDLSYPNKSYYTDGVNHLKHEWVERELEKASLLVDNVHGSKNNTTERMMQTLSDIESVITLCSGREYINTSVHGAIIRGTRYKKMDEWEQEEAAELHAKTTSVQHLVQINNNDDLHTRLANGYTGLSNLENELRKQKEDLDILLQTLEKLDTGRMSAKDLQRMLSQIQSLWAALIESELFEKVLQMTIQTQLMIYTRQIPVIANEKDMKQKAMLIKEHIGKICTNLSAKILLMLLSTNRAKEFITQRQHEQRR